MTSIVKYPRTPHLKWSGIGRPRTDKVLSSAEASEFLNGEILIEEKVDGANLGFSFDQCGDIIVQNRGEVLERGLKGQFASLWSWLGKHDAKMFDILADSFVLFGEWCYARHSIAYTRLPDYFLAFDVFDKRSDRFMNTSCRDEIIREIGLHCVPKITRGKFALDDLHCLIGKSAFYDGPMEGIYLRREDQLWLISRAKLVRSEFANISGAHWSKGALTLNVLAGK